MSDRLCPACGEPVHEEDEAHITAREDDHVYHFETCVEACDPCGTVDLVGELYGLFARTRGGEWVRYACDDCAADVRAGRL